MRRDRKKIVLRPIDEEGDGAEEVVRLTKPGEVVFSGVKEGGGAVVGEVRVRLPKLDRMAARMRSVEPNPEQLAVDEDRGEIEVDWEMKGGQECAFPWVLAMISAGGVLLLVLWLVVKVGGGRERQIEFFQEVDEVLKREERAVMAAEREIEAINGAGMGFLRAGSVEEMARYVRHPERVLPLMVDYYSRNPLGAFVVEGALAVEPLTLGDSGAFWIFGCDLAGGMYVQAMVELLDSGEAKVDWETFVCYQAMDWRGFAEGRPEGFVGDFRVCVEEDTLYSHEFSDQERYLCLRLSVLETEPVVFGYVERESAAGVAILELLAVEDLEGCVPMILTLGVPEGVGSPVGVEVLAVRAPRWVYMESPDGE